MPNEPLPGPPPLIPFPADPLPPGAPHPDWLLPDWPAASHVSAFMTTRAGGVSRGDLASLNLGVAVQDDPAAVAGNRRRVARAIGATPVFLAQVHGADVLHLQPDHLLPGAVLPRADASISTHPHIACAVQVADCLPVLFAAPGAVGGAHAGWRGLAGGVLENTVRALCEAARCEPAQVQAWLGACIGPQAFEVGADVLQAFGVPASAQDQPLFRHQPNEAGEPRWRADLAGLARQRLQALGLGGVHGGHWCTFSDASRFFSFRRERFDGRRSGRMAAVIRLRG